MWEEPLPLLFELTASIRKGASTGAGLGNAFLSNIRAVDGIFQVVRAFDDDEITHVEGDVDPIRDMEIIKTELKLKDIEENDAFVGFNELGWQSEEGGTRTYRLFFWRVSTDFAS